MPAKVFAIASGTPVAVQYSELDWYQRVEKVAKKAGLPIFEDLLCRKTTTVRLSGAEPQGLRDINSKQNFTSLEAFVTDRALTGGEEYIWETWLVDARAAAISKTFFISSEFHPKEVTRFYDEAENFLGRRPADAEEFWHVHHVGLQNHFDATAARNEQEKRCLSGQLADSRAEAANLRARSEQSTRLISDLQSDLEQKTRTLGNLPENFHEDFETVQQLLEQYAESQGNIEFLSASLTEAKGDLSDTNLQVVELTEELERYRNEMAGNEFTGRLRSALADSEHAMDLLRVLNGRLVAASRARKHHVASLETTVSNSRSLNKRLTGKIRVTKQEASVKEATIQELSQNRTDLAKKLSRAQKAKIASLVGIAIVSTFSITLALNILTV